jgi:4-hydroxy-4-methyl-2-oxoglutarate aldolase
VFPRLDAALKKKGLDADPLMYELGVVKRNIEARRPRAPPTAGRFGSATVHEAMGRVGLLKPYMRPIYPGAQVSGTAVTVLLQPGDNWMMHVAAEQIQPGDIVVAASPPSAPTASSATCWPPASWRAAPAALVIDAGVRDVKTLKEMGFPGVEQGDQRQGHDQGDARLGEHPGGLRRRAGHPGDVIVADDDGVVCVPPRGEEARVPPPQKREANEGEKRAKLASGVLGLDMYKMREPLEKAGLRYID